MYDKNKYILPNSFLHYWSISNLASKFRVVLMDNCTEGADHQTLHHYIVTFDDSSQELVVWEGITMDGEMRYEAIAAKKLKNDNKLNDQAYNMALWIFTSANPEALPGVGFF